METLALKVRIAVLWIFLAVCFCSAGFILNFYEPGVIEEIMSGKMEGTPITEGFLLFMYLFWLIPMIMAFLSIALKDSTNRLANMIVGILFVIFDIVHLIMHIAQGNLPLVHLVGIIFSIVAPALIVWYAWKWPKQD